MKTHSVGLAAMFASHLRTLSWTITFIRTDGMTLRYVQGRTAVTIAGDEYLPAPGFDVSRLTMTLGTEVDSAEITVNTDDAFIISNFLSGRWDNCQVIFRRFNYKDPTQGFDSFPLYRISNVEPMLGQFKIELRDMRQEWQKNFTRSLSKTCEYRLGDTRCKVNLASFTDTFTVATVTNRTTFIVAPLGRADNWFTHGSITFASGLYQGLSLLVRSSTGNTIVLAIPLFEDITVGQTGSLIAGCTKRKEEDCRVKFNNILNNGAMGADAPTIGQMAGEDAP